MQARLSFSVAAAVSPDILIIDEALATGDALFVQKSLGRIHEICKKGATAVFVSHNMQQIQRLCDRVLLMDKGRIKMDGKAMEVGPLARMLVAYLDGKHPEIKSIIDSVLQEVNGEPKHLFSVLGRHAARAIECKLVAHRCMEWLGQLNPTSPTYQDYNIPLLTFPIA